MKKDFKQKIQSDEKDEKKEDVAVEENEELFQLKKNAQEYLAGWKRCQADFENYKKIQIENQKDLIRYATQNVVLQIIPVIDNFYAATQHIPADQQAGGWAMGIMYIQKQLEDVLTQNGVSEIEVKIGDVFDPNLHEALENSQKEKKESSEKENDKIEKIVSKGYKIEEKVIRPAKVIV